MTQLAAVYLGDTLPLDRMGADELRQLGYCAQLGHRRVDDRTGRLKMLAKQCRNMLAETGRVSQRTYSDPLQKLWEAPWPMDARKLKTEFPVNVATLQSRRAKARNESGLDTQADPTP